LDGEVLSDEMQTKIDYHHLELAQHVLGGNCVIGLCSQFQESLRRFAKYFDWESKSDPDSIQVCSDKLGINTKTGSPGDETFILGKIGEEVDKAIYAEGTELNDILRPKNQFDIALYENAKGLFQRQALYSTK
jgi:hypothetical protein